MASLRHRSIITRRIAHRVLMGTMSIELTLFNLGYKLCDMQHTIKSPG